MDMGRESRWEKDAMTVEIGFALVTSWTKLGSRGDLDWSRCAIDSVNMRALKRGT